MKKVAFALILMSALTYVPVVAQECTTPNDTNHQFTWQDTYIAVGGLIIDGIDNLVRWYYNTR